MKISPKLASELMSSMLSSILHKGTSVDFSGLLENLFYSIRDWDRNDIENIRTANTDYQLLRLIEASLDDYNGSLVSANNNPFLALYGAMLFKATYHGINLFSQSLDSIKFGIDWISLLSSSLNESLISHELGSKKLNALSYVGPITQIGQYFGIDCQDTRRKLNNIGMHESQSLNFVAITDWIASSDAQSTGMARATKHFAVSIQENTLNIWISCDFSAYLIADECILVNMISQFFASRIPVEISNAVYQAQILGRSGKISNHSAEWWDLSNLPSLSRCPLLSISRSTPCIATACFNSSQECSDLSLIQDSSIHTYHWLGIVDTLSSLSYLNHVKMSNNTPLTASQDDVVLRNEPHTEKTFLDVSRISARRKIHTPNTIPIAKSSYIKLDGWCGKVHDFHISMSSIDLASITYCAKSGRGLNILNSGVLNASSRSDKNGTLLVWRYEPNYLGWSGKLIDAFRTQSLTLAAYYAENDILAEVFELLPVGFPDMSWIEDIRLYIMESNFFATCALFLPSHYASHLSFETGFQEHNTGTGMIVTQCKCKIELSKRLIIFDGFVILDSHVEPKLPTIFEKNWAAWDSSYGFRLIYSLEPFRLFNRSSSNSSYFKELLLSNNSTQSIKNLLGATPRNSCHLVNLANTSLDQDVSIGLFHVKKDGYYYVQYLYCVDNKTGCFLGFNRSPFMSIDPDLAPAILASGFWKNKGVCYVSDMFATDMELVVLVNLYDTQSWRVTMNLSDCIARLSEACDDYVPFS